jgi:outer membrane protein assembly factor BamB
MRKVLILSGLLALTVPVLAADWPHYRGVNHDGKSPEKIAKTWPTEGPKTVWKVPMGEGFSAVSVVGDRAYCFASVEEQETVIAMESGTGKQLWAVPIDKKIYDRQGGNGPRSTPAIDGGLVYILGTYGKLAALNAADGKIVWQHDLNAEFGGKTIQWGYAASPVIEGDVVLVCAGGEGQSLLGFNKKTGAVIWKGQSDGMTHATPTPATLFGTRQVIFRTDRGLVSVVPTSGDVLWRYGFPHSVSSAASPIVGDDMVYVSSAYGVGAGAAKIGKDGDKWTVTELWTDKGLQNHWTTPVYKDGHLYGLYKRPVDGLRCIEMATGKEKWTKGGFAWEGATILVDGDVLVQNNRGEMVLVKATPDKYEELARAQPLGGQTWTMATVANGRIFGRSMTEAVCLDVKPQLAKLR